MRTRAPRPLRPLVLLAVGTLAGCSSFLPPLQDDEPPKFKFRLGSGDEIRVHMWAQKQLHVWGKEGTYRDLRLGPDGSVSLPLIGDVGLAGMTMNEARVELAKRLKTDFYVDPVVSVTLLQMRSHVLHVLGEVNKPGTVSFVRGATVLAAIQAAGGARAGTAELTEIRIIRDRTSAPKVYEIDLTQVMAGEKRDMWLIPGDSVYVPTRSLTLWSRWWRQFFFWSDPVEAPR